MSEQFTTIGIADDHQIFRDGLRASLMEQPLFEVVWEADSGQDLMHNLAAKTPDVLLLDFRIPDMDGINAIARIRRDFHQLRIIVLTMYDDAEAISRIMESGANAYLTKTADHQEIRTAIVTCVNEEFYFNDLVNQALLMKLQRKRSVLQTYQRPIRFTEKELRVLQMIADDKTTPEIAASVFLSPRTVETIRQQMKQKAGVNTIAGLVMYATRNKLLE